MIRYATALLLLAGVLAAQAQNNSGKAAISVSAGKQVFEAKLFAESTISTPTSFSITFTPDGKTAYFARGMPERRCFIMESHVRDGKWSAPVPASFSGQYRDGDPFLSPDGSQLFFWSTRPLKGRQRNYPALWVVDKTEKGWTEPRDLGAWINGPDGGGGFPSVAANGTLYFFAQRPDSLGGTDLYRARRAGEKFGTPENLGPEINSAQGDLDAYVAPDESFIIFDSERPGGFGGGDLYISTRKNGAWTAPRNLGPSINSAAGECCPAVSRDEKTFFFTSQRPEGRGIYQIDIRALGLEQK